MRRIGKRSPGPRGLVALERRGGSYRELGEGTDNSVLEAKVRTALLEDQGYLCCYCMRRLDPERTVVRIEHHEAQSSNPRRQLDWTNLLAACSGASMQRTRTKHKAVPKVPPERQICDRRKGNERISINPLTESVDALRYGANGHLAHPDPDMQNDLEERLNLNVDFLVEARLSAVDALIDHVTKKLGPNRTWTAEALRRYLVARKGGRYPAYFGVIERRLERWIAKRAD